MQATDRSSGTGFPLTVVAGPLWLAAAASQALFQRGMPSTETATGDAITWFNQHRRRFLAGQVVGGLGFALFYLPFLGRIVEEVRDVPRARPWATAALGAGLLSPAAGTAGGAVLTVLARSAGQAPAVAEKEIPISLGAAEYAFSVSGTLLGLVPGFIAVGRWMSGGTSRSSWIIALATGALHHDGSGWTA